MNQYRLVLRRAEDLFLESDFRCSCKDNQAAIKLAKWMTGDGDDVEVWQGVDLLGIIASSAQSLSEVNRRANNSETIWPESIEARANLST